MKKESPLVILAVFFAIILGVGGVWTSLPMRFL